MGYIEFEKTVTASNYDPLPIVLRQAKGVWVTDVDGRHYLEIASLFEQHPIVMLVWSNLFPPDPGN